jgi:exodeoxyribonuclease VII large subunit
VREFLTEAFPAVWVVGEAQRVRASQRGHLYFELIEKGENDEIVGKLEAVVWKTDFQKVRRLLTASGQQIADGMQVRCRGSLDFYAPTGRLQLCVREVDPAFTLGLLERRRRETLAVLTAAGLLERNRALPLAELPLTLALITSQGSAAYHDFLSGLAESGYGFRVLFLHASVQGRDAERELISALTAVAGFAVDCTVLIRGGGARSDLAVFDSRAVAESITRLPHPLLTGLGHEIDRSIADLAAHTALKTPTKVAEFLVERVGTSELRLAELRFAIAREVVERLRAGREGLGRAERGVELARLRLAGAGERLAERGRTLARLGRSALRQALRRQAELRQRLATAAPGELAAGERRRTRTAASLLAAARSHLRAAQATLEGKQRLTVQLDPQRTLERGFSLTRDAGGVLLRRPEQAAAGDLITTRLAGGNLTSRVEDPT